MARIYKYDLAIDDVVDISMPHGARVLDVQMQGATPCLWALVDPEAPKVSRRFRIIGTGNPFPDAEGQCHVATFQMHGGRLVWHVFEADR